MSQRRVCLLLLCTLIFIAGSYLAAAGSGGKLADLAAGDVSFGIDESPLLVTARSSDELIAFWSGRSRRNSGDYISLTYLGQAYIAKARETGDAGAFVRAEAALQQALELNPDYELALAYLSTVLFARHDFQGALDLAQRVYDFDPLALQALATIGDAHLELGHYEAAAAAYEELMARAPGPPVYSRLARLVWLHGRPGEAIALMQQAAGEASDVALTGESLAWYHFQLGELYFQSGRLEAAGDAYGASLAAFDNYYLALAGLGKVQAAQGKLVEAIDYYERATAITPQPDLLATLGDLYTLNGDAEAAQHQYDTVTFIAGLEAMNQVLYNRQLVNYYANHDTHLVEALAMARQELAVRADVYGYDALAWALYKNGRYQEAAEAMAKALAPGTQDAALYYHAGMIVAALGQTEQAEKLLAQALAINLYFDVLQAPIARTKLSELRAARSEGSEQRTDT